MKRNYKKKKVKLLMFKQRKTVVRNTFVGQRGGHVLQLRGVMKREKKSCSGSDAVGHLHTDLTSIQPPPLRGSTW